MIKIGDIVTRKKYGNDILFKVCKICNKKVILKGIDLRLYADAEYSDLVLTTINKKKEIVNQIRNLQTNKYFYIPGLILQFDSDKEYLNKCLEYYKTQKVKCIGYIFSEKEYKDNIIKLIEKHNPSIIVITGHDAYHKEYNNYKNSKYFVETVKQIREKYRDIIIISGACQSDFESLIKAGSTYASSPKHLNINALDPAIIASYLALTSNTKYIELEDILSKTTYGPDSIGGIKTLGCMIIGYPRKD